MSEQIQMIIILFVFAFLIGFFLAHLLRKSAYRKKYEKRITKLEEDEQNAKRQYAQTLEREKDIRARYDAVHDTYETQKNQLDTLANEEASLLEQITSLEYEKEQLKKKIASSDLQIAEVKEEITHLSTELENLNRLREISNENDKKISLLDEQIKDRKRVVETYLDDIEKLKTVRKQLKEEIGKHNDTLAHLRNELSEATNKVNAIEQKYLGKLHTLTEEVQDLKIRALNYEYALKEYATIPDNRATQVTNGIVQTIFRMPNSKTVEIEKFVKKNDRRRWFDKLTRKLFKKASAIDEEI